MKRFFIAAIIGATVFITGNAQQEVTDTLALPAATHFGTASPTAVGDSVQTTRADYHYKGVFIGEPDSTGVYHPIIFYPGIYPQQAPLITWDSGALVAAGQHEELYGLMNRDSAVLNFYQQFGNFTVTAYGSADKFGFFRGLATQWGYGGSLSYQLTDNLSFTTFGSYATNAHIYNPAMLGYASYPVYGAYANYRFGDSKFGVKAGVQRHYYPTAQRWETQPMVVPYYQIAPGADLGVDIGGILYNLIRSNKQSPNIGNGMSSGNPTIAPPKFNNGM
jgi:hypothetical protein